MHRDSKIFIVGHNDSVENSLRGYFQAQGFPHVISSTYDVIDVLNESSADDFFKEFKPEYVFLGSLRSGGIAANQKFPAEFIYENIQSQNLVIDAARRNDVKKLLYFSSSCVYPPKAKQPIKESSLLTGPLVSLKSPLEKCMAALKNMKLFFFNSDHNFSESNPPFLVILNKSPTASITM